MKHSYWGSIENDWNGFSSDVYFEHPFFGDKKFTVFLGESLDDEGEEVEEPPTAEILKNFEQTYAAFITNIDQHLAEIQQKAFDRYIKLYAHYYEHTEKSGEPPLGLNTIEKHNATIKNIMYLRLSEGDELRITISYTVDTEHGMEFLFIKGVLDHVGGISDT